MGKPVTTSRISTAPDCAYCRSSRLAPQAGTPHVFKCGIGKPGPAPSCESFRDSRKSSSNAHNLPESAK